MENKNASKVEDFNKNGFLHLENVIDPSLIEKARNLTNNLLSIDNNYNLFPSYFLNDRKENGVLYDIYFRHKYYRDLVENDYLSQILSDLLDQNYFLYESSLVYKPAGKRNEVPFHQDFMDRPSEPFKIIIWVALSDVTAENGALKIIPGSHKKGFREFIKVKGETHHTRLKGWETFNENSMLLEMSKGDILLFHNMAIHGSDRSNSTSDRLAARYAVQNFNSRSIPRGIPSILSLNSDYSNFEDVHTDSFVNENFKTKLLRKIRQYSTKNFPV